LEGKNMFVVIYDPYGTLVDAVCASKGHETREDAVVAMHELFDHDCENYLDKYQDAADFLSDSGDDYLFTPRGYEDAMYKVIEI
jgi:hypothetical protein